MDEDRLTDPLEHGPEEERFDRTLRPRRLDDYIGQHHVIDNLRILIEAARRRQEPVEHVLLSGPPGLGKTTLAGIIANELDVQIRTTSGPAIDHAGALASLLTNLGDRDILFIDEVHRLNTAVEEALYPALEDFKFDFVTGKGAGAMAMQLPLSRFTCIGATTRQGLLSGPMRDRFGAVYRLDFYDEEDLEHIVRRSSRLLDFEIDREAARELARRSRGTPRIANRLLRRVRDYADVRAQGRGTLQVARQALRMLDVDEVGLEPMDRRILRLIIESFGGGPVGLDTVAAALAEESETIEDVHEPFLIQSGLLARTSRGRVATVAAYRHLDLPPPEAGGDRGAPVSDDGRPDNQQEIPF